MQNGILLSTALHPYWDTHGFSIHPVFPCLISYAKEIIQGDKRVQFFVDNMYQQMYDRRQVQFNPTTPELPTPPDAFLLEHFRQAILANMKGAGKVQIYDIETSEDAQDMSIFEAGEGREYLEGFMTDKLLNREARSGKVLDVSQ